MQWILDYQLFLFDFDGLLVDTERLHYQSYIRMCEQRGFHLNWSFERYSIAAHHTPTDLRDRIYAEIPNLHIMEPNWQVLYEEKKRHFIKLIEYETVPLMPGATELLLALQEAGIKRCVVTHSANLLIQQIRKQNPILNTIPNWITREDYTQPKPNPECYQIAIQRFGEPHDHIIGFEDSPRGLHALLETKVKPVLICPPDSHYISSMMRYPQVSYYPSFNTIQDDLKLYHL